MILYSNNNIKFKAENFAANEIEKESDQNTFVVTPKLLQTLKGLDILREEIGEALIVSDGCRFNSDEGSQHHFKHYNAIDVYAHNYTSMELMKVVEDLGLFTGRGVYPGDKIIHVDCRRGLYPNKTGNRISRWYRKNGDYYAWNRDYYNNPFNGLVF